MGHDTRGMSFAAHPVLATSDIEEAGTALESVFPTLRLRLHAPSTATSQLNMVFNSLRIGEVTASYLRFGPRVHVDGFAFENFFVNVPLRGVAQSQTGQLPWVRATTERGAVLLPDLPAKVDWGVDCTQACIRLPRRLVRRELEALLDRPVPGSIQFAPAMDLTTDCGRTWVAALHLLDRHSRAQHGVLEHPLAMANLEKLMINSLLMAQPHTYTDALTRPHPPTAPSTVSLAIELIHTHPEQAWSTATLAQAVAVSARSLQEGFQRSTGIPPMRYLRDVRLDRVHADLLAASAASVTVSQVARRWGFLYLGRFAAAYRKRFGRSPSETLRAR